MLLDAPLDTGLHCSFVSALVRRAPAVFATVLTGDEQALQKLERILRTRAEEIPSDPKASLERLRRFLFVSDIPSGGVADATVDFFSAPGEGLECVEIARRIRDLAAGGLAFDRMAILLRSPDRYQPLVEEVLRRSGVPGYFSRGTVRPDPGGRAFLALLACAAEGCSASRFDEYLSLGQVLRGSGTVRLGSSRRRFAVRFK